MSQSSENISQQFINGGVVPAQLVSQNAVSKAYVDEQLAIRDEKLDTIQTGAEVNQNAFAQVNGVVAKNKSDQFRIVGDVGIQVTENTLDNSIHLTVTGESAPGNHASTHLTGGSDPIPVATETTSGLLGPTDKTLINVLRNAQKKANTSAMYAHAISDIGVLPGKMITAAVRAAYAGTLKVAVMGDSISEGGDLVLASEAYVPKLEQALKNALPGVTVTLQNFSLGGRRINNAIDPNFVGGTSDTDTTFFRSWSVIGKSWLNHVKDFQPNLLIIAFGMNEAWVATSDNTFYTRLKSLVDSSQSWTVKPSPVYVSTILPTNNPAYYDQRQDITKSVNRAGRILAKEYGLPIVDAGRLWEIVRDGVDDQYTSAVKVANFEDYSSWTGDKNSFTLANGVLTPNAGATGKFVQSAKLIYNGDISVTIKPTIEDVNGTTWIMYRYSDLGHMLVMAGAGSGTGFLRLYTYDDGAYTPLVDLANLNIPINTATRIVIRPLNERHQVFLNGGLLIDQVSVTNLHEGSIRLGSNYTPPTFSALDINYGDPIKGDQLYTELELLGPYNSAQSGNAINHPTGLGHAVSYCAAYSGMVSAISAGYTTMRLINGA